ncbi:MAG: ABC transporter substrate-binding protein, partial [Plesiomonas sp.]
MNTTFGMLLGVMLPLCAVAADVPLGTDLAKQQVVVRANGKDPSMLDPNIADADFATQAVLSDLFEGLVQEGDNGENIPAQAERWITSPDGKSMTFWLRENAHWSDGTPVEAADFVAGWQRAVNPKTRLSNRNYMAEAGIANADLIGRGKLSPDKLGVSALEPKVLQVTFDKPMPFFMSMLSLPAFMPAPRQQLKQG